MSCPTDGLPDSILADILTRSAAWHGRPRDVDDSEDRTIDGFARGWPAAGLCQRTFCGQMLRGSAKCACCQEGSGH
jgi:hypothetical protein